MTANAGSSEPRKNEKLKNFPTLEGTRDSMALELFLCDFFSGRGSLCWDFETVSGSRPLVKILNQLSALPPAAAAAAAANAM